MAITRPISEQISFTSSKTGTHVLDTYLEACEFNNRNLYDMLGDLWDTSTGLVDSDSFQIRVNSTTRQLQNRMGTFSDPAASWTGVDDGYIFRQRGAHANSTAYEQLDVVTYNNGTYICDTKHTSSTAAPDTTKFTTILDGTALSTAESNASTSATNAATSATNASTSATLAQDWAEKTSGPVTGSSYSAKYWASHADVSTVATNITDITTVAGKATEIGRLGTADAVADMAILGTTDVVADMNTLATADIVADMNTLGTSANVTNMDTCATNIANINSVAGDATDIGTVAGKATEIGRLGTADAVSDMNTLAVTAVINDMDTCATNATNISNVGGSIANVNTVSTNIANVNTTATNIADVNAFSNIYRIAATAPSTSLDEGDLWWDSSNDALKVRTSSAWYDPVASATTQATNASSSATAAANSATSAASHASTFATLGFFADWGDLGTAGGSPTDYGALT